MARTPKTAPAAGDKRYLALGFVEIDGETSAKGEVITGLDDERAEQLKAAGAIVDAPDDSAATA